MVTAGVGATFRNFPSSTMAYACSRASFAGIWSEAQYACRSDATVHASTGTRRSTASISTSSADAEDSVPSDAFAHASSITFTVTASHSTPGTAFPSSNAASARSPRPARPHAKIIDASDALSGAGYGRDDDAGFEPAPSSSSSRCSVVEELIREPAAALSIPRHMSSASSKLPSREHAASAAFAHAVVAFTRRAREEVPTANSRNSRAAAEDAGSPASSRLRKISNPPAGRSPRR